LVCKQFYQLRIVDVRNIPPLSSDVCNFVEKFEDNTTELLMVLSCNQTARNEPCAVLTFEKSPLKHKSLQGSIELRQKDSAQKDARLPDDPLVLRLRKSQRKNVHQNKVG
jgi:hypothetical protein